jgi:predicted glycosyl hydrolase (DUF1957 family)
MDRNCIELIKNNTKTISGAITEAIKSHKELCKNNTKDWEKYLKDMVDDLKERKNSGHVSVGGLI